MAEQDTRRTLDLSGNSSDQVAVVKINGVEYLLKTSNDFSLVEAAKMAQLQRKWNTALRQTIDNPEDGQAAEQAEAALSNLICMLVVGLDAAVVATLSFRQRLQVLDFFGQQNPTTPDQGALSATSPG